MLINGQKSDRFRYPIYEFEQGVELYNNGSYAGALNAFTRASKELKTSPLIEDCSYYVAITAVKLEKSEGESMLLDFTEKYPTSRYRNKAFLDAGNYYYNNGKPSKSLKWFQKVSPKHLTSKEEDIFNFKIGYAYFSNKKFTEAKQYFLPLTKSAKLGSEAKYYFGYISYVQEDYKTALKYFDQLSGNKTYYKEILYYKINIEFQNNNFQNAIKHGNDLLKIATRKEVSEISKIIGESHFYLGNYEKAIVNLKKYKGKRNRLVNEDHYFLGYSYYKVNDYENAILRFNKITNGKNEVAQNAYYHLGDCYLKQNKNSEALNAFKNSSELNFNQEIKEDAAYNYAKLSYQIGNPYKSSAEVLQEYVENYTTSPNARDISKLIIDTYNSSRDFKGALNYYERRNLVKDTEYYEITLHQGMQLFKYSKFQEALRFFKISSSQVISLKTQSKSLFWKAETSYRLRDFKSALADYKRFLKLRTSKKIDEYKNVNYSIGYAYFKVKDYKRAKSSFSSYIKNNTNEPVKINDSYIRLGDCNFISKSYWEAIEAYNAVISKKGIDDDYAQYQKAISYGLLNRNENKIKTLKTFDKQHPKSSYKDDALYELGNAYISAKENQFAIAAYDELIQKHATSLYIPRSLLKQGLIYFNDNNSEKSIEKYKSVVGIYPNSKEAQEAIKNAKQVYIDIDKVDEYASWLKQINYTSFTDIDLDNAMYEAAEKKYLANKFLMAVSSFKKYLINFPQGINALKANFYSAQAYFSLENTEKSLPKYLYVVEQNSNEYTEQSLARLVQIYLEKNNWTEAIPFLKRLELEANFPQNVLFAQSNLMKAMYEKKQYPETVRYAEKVLSHKKADIQIKSDANIFIARSAIQTRDMEKAKIAYSKIPSEATEILKAEALYYKAYFKSRDGAYEDSNKIIQKLASTYANYKFWGVRGLILMAENNIGLDDTFQATYILENVIKNYKQYEELILESERLLEEILTAEKFKNKPVDTIDTEKEKLEELEETTNF